MMCISQGCDDLHDDHGDERNITVRTLREAAEAADTDEDHVVRRIQDAWGLLGSETSGSQRTRPSETNPVNDSPGSR